MKFDGYKPLGGGAAFFVHSSKKIPSQCSSAPMEDIARAHNILDQISERGLSGFPESSFLNEGRFKSGRSNVPEQTVYAVKSYQLRVYCGVVAGDQLVCVEASVKKSQKADQKILKRVAKELGRLNEQP